MFFFQRLFTFKIHESVDQMPLDYILPVKQTASTNRNGVNKQNTRHTLSHTHTHTHTHTRTPNIQTLERISQYENK